MNPFQQMWIVGTVGAAVIGGTDDSRVDALDHVDGSLRFGRWTKGGGSQEICGALEATPWVGLEIAVRRNAGHSERLQRLKE
jgi:hypothetical protein